MSAAHRVLRRPLRLAAILMAGSVLAACASDGATQAAAPAPNDERAAAIADLKSRPVPDDPIGKAAYWAQRSEVEPDNVEISVQFAKALRGIGSNDRAVEFLEERLIKQPGQPELMAEYGKSLVAARRPQEALPVLAQARQMKPDDWTILVAQGVAYDQLGDFPHARQSYEAALAISPNNPAILNNLGLSYMMAGDKQNAAKYLRMAAAAPGANAQVRANLAMVADVPVAAAEAPPPAPPVEAAEAAPAPAPAPASKPAPKPKTERAMTTPVAKPVATPAAEVPVATGAPRAMATTKGASELRGSD
ncbi:Beta-barrel assembly-enhancing protease [Alphaproteobacteria bacterium SO-S41]|nr:Beta-barrel assembly-enhancing protease [Alphaproteobacteria bacterium SO-S41]